MKYIALKMKDAIRTYGIKKEKDTKTTGLVDNIENNINDYIEKHRIHFYKTEDGTEMVKMHVDDLYDYSDSNTTTNLPSL